MKPSEKRQNFKEIRFSDCRTALDIPEGFDDSNLLITDGEISELPKLKFNRHGSTGQSIKGCKFEIPRSANGVIRITLASSNSIVKIGKHTRLTLDLRLWRSPRVEIGDHTTINSARFVADKSDIYVGSDCMFSDDVLLQSNDQHGIWDIDNDMLVNSERRSIKIGDHVWVGRKVTVMPDVHIGRGSILGTGSILTKGIDPCSIAVGVPARVVKSRASWTRSPHRKNEREEHFFSQFAKG